MTVEINSLDGYDILLICKLNLHSDFVSVDSGVNYTAHLLMFQKYYLCLAIFSSTSSRQSLHMRNITRWTCGELRSMSLFFLFSFYGRGQLKIRVIKSRTWISRNTLICKSDWQIIEISSHQVYLDITIIHTLSSRWPELKRHSP